MKLFERDPHPLRRFRLVPHYPKVLAKLRAEMNRPAARGTVNGAPVLFFEREMHLPFRDGDIREFGDLLAAMFIRQRTYADDDSFLKYWDEHRQIFELDHVLADALSNTEISQVPWSELRLPHEEFYLCFGDFGQPTFSINERRYIIDGAYVRRVPKSASLPPDSLMMSFTGRLVEPTYEEVIGAVEGTTLRFGDPSYDYYVCGEGAETIGQAIENGASWGRKAHDAQDKMLVDSGLNIAEVFDVADTAFQRITPFRDKFERGRSFVEPFLPLLFNAIFYLCQRPEAQTERVPDSAPPDDAAILRSTSNPAIRASVLNRLAKRGVTTVRFVRDPDLNSDREASAPSGRKVRAHWRRGHWRKQVWGPGQSLRRWMWILPVLVKKEVELSLGTVHRVAGDDLPFPQT